MKPLDFQKKNSSCIDNCITNDKDNCGVSLEDFYLSDHKGIVNKIAIEHIRTTINKTEIIKFRPLSKLSIEMCVRKLICWDWSELDNAPDVDTSCNYLMQVISESLDEYFPIKTKTVHCQNKPKKWFNSELKTIRDNISFLTYFAKNNSSINLKDQIVNARKLYKQRKTELKTKYIREKILQSCNKQKTMWEMINESKTKIKPFHNITPDDFNDYFVNVVLQVTKALSGSDGSIPDPVALTACFVNSRDTFFLTPVVEDDVNQFIKKLRNSRAKDVFGLSNTLIKEIGNGLVIPMTILINKCFLLGKFPEKLKVSRVCPIYKKDDPNEKNNYRPISLVPILSKLIEMAFACRLINFLDSKHLLSRMQFGYRKNLSTTNALIEFVTDIVGAFEAGETVTAAFCDLSKAFDCVCHNTLLAKLGYYGVRGNAHDFLRSYLEHRRQLVDCDGAWSSSLPILAGVPQGSILGPILFVIYVNDLPHYLEDINIIQYADDTTLYSAHKNKQTSENTINVNLNKAEKWFQANSLALNLGKTAILNMSLGKNSEDNPVKFLGLYIDSGLSFKCHIAKLSSSLSKVIYFIRKIKHYSTMETMKLAYMGLFHSRLNYAILLWGNTVDWPVIFKQQKRAIRVIVNVSQRQSCREYFRQLKIMTVPALYIYQCLSFVKNNLDSLTTHDDIHDYETRNKNKIIIPRHRLTATRKSFIVSAVKFYNHLPDSFKSLSTRKFKHEIKKLLISIRPYNYSEYFGTI